MEDVQNQNVSEAETPVEETTEQVPQPEEQTTETEEVEAPQERTVPLKALEAERKRRQEFQRKLAEVEGNQKLNGYDPEDLSAVMQHPFVQEMLIKQAKQELTDYARTTLDLYPGLHPAVKKAILGNARGFVNESTTDVETAKLDLAEYIESIAEEAETQNPSIPKSIKVAATNVSKTDIQGMRPAEIQKILDKPLDSWTDEEATAVEQYSKSTK